MVFIQSALQPPNEAMRLATLQTYNILYSLRESLFTEVVEFAATLFNVPISLLALVGGDEVNYIATHGLPGLRSQSCAEAICSMVVEQQQAVVFVDLARARSLTAEAEAVALAKGLRFYAGVPLCMPNQQCIGTFCLIGQQPRTFSAPEQQVLEQLARLAGQLIAVHQYCTVSPAQGVEYWRLVRSELAQEIRILMASAQYVIGYAGTHVPVPANVLEATYGQLHELCWRLADYYPGSAPG